MKNIVFYLLFVAAIVALFGFAFSMAQETVPAGQKIFLESKCTACHSVNTAGITSNKKEAVDLSKTGDNLNTNFITRYLNKEVKQNDKLHKTAFKGSAENLNTLASWLTSLQSAK
ncbi:MAG TPA: c-type cytochrome [Ignavibacteriaceae bacterium]|jgi:mono/diheme cytochrome c family protein|nr:c-type cytochrome [Ignavibacteriaceae bacterium]